MREKGRGIEVERKKNDEEDMDVGRLRLTNKFYKVGRF